MTIHVPNPEVLKAAFDHIEKNLAYWNQEMWLARPLDRSEIPAENACGTTACLAGHILLVEGRSWEQLRSVDIPEEAMLALGYTRIEVPWSDDPDDGVELRWDGDGDAFERIFFWVRDEDGVKMAFNKEVFEKFKAYVSKQTGVEL